MINIPEDMNSRPSVATRLKMWWSDFPLLSRVLFCVCVIIFILEAVDVISKSDCCFSPFKIWLSFAQVYRVFSSPYLHLDIFHLLFNMMALVSIAPMLERMCGTAALLVLTLFFEVAIAILDFLLCFVTWKIANYHNVGFLESMFPFVACAIGFSGVLFSYLTMEVSSHEVSSYSFFGCFTIPSQIYPWVLLLLIQLLMPGVSFAGHLSGILAGYAASFLLKSRLTRTDCAVPSCIKRIPCYKLGPAGFVHYGVQSTGTQPAQPSFMSRFSNISSTWNPIPQSTPTPQPFPGQGRVLGTGVSPSRSPV
jgi:membrane associated rhomboid family serine protease